MFLAVVLSVRKDFPLCQGKTNGSSRSQVTLDSFLLHSAIVLLEGVWALELVYTIRCPCRYSLKIYLFCSFAVAVASVALFCIN